MKKLSLSKFSRGMIIFLGICSILLIITTTLEQNGIRMLFTEFNLVGCGVMVLALLVWGAGLIFLRMKSRTAKLVVGTLLGLILMMIAVFIFTFLMMFGEFSLPQHFGTIESPAGRKVAIMYTEDTGLASLEEYEAMLARMNARVEYMNAETEAPAETTETEAPAETTESAETTETEAPAESTEIAEAVAGYPGEARGYIFSAFPRKLGFFFDVNADVEGMIYRGYASKAKILYEWIDETTVRLYLENAEPGDSGEVILRLAD